jgi:hypothetical protein
MCPAQIMTENAKDRRRASTRAEVRKIGRVTRVTKQAQDDLEVIYGGYPLPSAR